MRLAIALLLGVTAVSGCTRVESRIETYHSMSQVEGTATIAILPYNRDKQGSLEFAAFAKKLAAKLEESGYSVVNIGEAGDADHAAFLAYGIDDGTMVTEAYSIPQWGVTGYSSSYTSGTLSTLGSTGFYSGTTTYQPQYGITGYSTGTTSYAIYTRALILDIYKVDELMSGQSKRIYEAKLTSQGKCGAIGPVFDEMLEALFEDFPGESGETRTASVTMDGDC